MRYLFPGSISVNLNRKCSRRNVRYGGAAENICRHQRQDPSSMLICLFVTFMFQSVKNDIISFRQTENTTNSRAATNQNSKACVCFTKTEHQFINIFYSRRNRNPSDSTDSVRYYLTENIARSSKRFAYISRKLNCLKLQQ